MPTVRAIAVAATNVGSPRASVSVDYDGTSDKSVLVVLVCPTWAAAAPAQVVTIRVQQSFDAEASWQDFAILTTTGRRVSRVGGLMPQMSCQCIDNRGARKVRITIEVDRASLAAGVDLTT